jgi:heterodisulfide reductase subunit B
VIKQVNNDMATDEEIASKANNYLQLEEPYHGETKVLHYLEVLRDTVGFDAIREKVVNPFTGQKIAAYYGCLLLRPGKVMQMDNPENPRIIEDFIRAIGGEPVIYPYRNECCGGYVTMEDKSLAAKKSTTVLDSAEKAGAQLVITACPLCLYNLRKNGQSDLPVVYFTELLAQALGVKEGL